MAHTTESRTCWTAADLLDRFGPMQLGRIINSPAPGTADERDVVDLNDRQGRLCELIDGVLVEKTVGTYESQLAALFTWFLIDFVRPRDLGVVLGADGMLLLAPRQVRIPDVSFISWGRIPGRRLPRDPIARIVPDLAVEFISPSNTAREMESKLAEYFVAGVRLMWYVYPIEREVHVYDSPDHCTVVGHQESLTGGDVLPGFSLALSELFAA